MHNLSTEVQPVSAPPATGAPAAVGARVSGRRLALVLYGAVALLYWAALYTYVPTLPTYAATFTSNLALIGTILSMYGLWQALARLPFGIASDWVGWRKPFIVLGLGLTAGGALLMASAHTPQALLIGRSVTGLAAATWVPLTVVFSSLFAADKAVQATTTLTVMSAIARVIATASNGALNAIGGYSLAFLVAAVLAGLGILLVLPAAETRRPVKAPTAAGIGRIITRKDVLLPSALSAVAHYVLMGVVYGFMPLLAKELGLGDSMVSNLTVVHLGVFLPSVLATAFLLRHFSARSLVVFSFVALALGAAGGAVAHSVVGLLAVQVLVGMGFGICYPILMGMSIEKVDASERATAMGLHQSIYSIGMFAGPWFSGILAVSLGMRSMFAVTGMAVLLVGVLGTLWVTAYQRAAAGRT